VGEDKRTLGKIYGCAFPYPLPYACWELLVHMRNARQRRCISLLCEKICQGPRLHLSLSMPCMAKPGKFWVYLSNLKNSYLSSGFAGFALHRLGHNNYHGPYDCSRHGNNESSTMGSSKHRELPSEKQR
jgi:hypothetical protein